MAEPPKPRAWFQLHLSTCVVLMMVAGILPALNLRDSDDPIGMNYLGSWQSISPARPSDDYVTRGWPFVCRVQVAGPEAMYAYWRTGALALDIAVAVLVLLSVAAVCEWRIRERLRSQTIRS